MRRRILCTWYATRSTWNPLPARGHHRGSQPAHSPHHQPARRLGPIQDAYRAYAYFRWVDDHIDVTLRDRGDRIAFVERQQAIIDRRTRRAACRPDRRGADDRRLDRSDIEPDSGLRLYIENMMAVMAFDAERRGRLIPRELNEYTHALAVGVTEAVHYFIGHDDPRRTAHRAIWPSRRRTSPTCCATPAKTWAQATSMPREYLAEHGIGPGDVHSAAYRAWIQSRPAGARLFSGGPRASGAGSERSLPDGRPCLLRAVRVRARRFRAQRLLAARR